MRRKKSEIVILLSDKAIKKLIALSKALKLPPSAVIEKLIEKEMIQNDNLA